MQHDDHSPKPEKLSESIRTNQSRVIAEGLDAAQCRLLLASLVQERFINCIGTPSREEVVNPKPAQSGVLQALGGFLQGGLMDNMMIELTTDIVAMRDNTTRFDVSILTVPVEGFPGISEAVVAQVYPSEPTTGKGMVQSDFIKLIDAITTHR